MTISVRMDTLLERELELVAKRRGITKSQFVIEAVERALGHKDPYQLLLQAREPVAVYGEVATPAASAATAGAGMSTGERVRQKLKARQADANADWLAQRDPSASAPSTD